VPHSRWQQAVAEFGNRLPAPLILIVALILIQVSSGAAKLIMTPANVNGLVLFRVALGSLLMWVVIRPGVAHLDRRQWLDVILLGVVIAAFSIASYTALTRLPLGLAATIGFLGPISVSLFAARRLFEIVWPGLAFLGVFLLAPASPGADVSWSALGYGLAYAATWALYILTSVRATHSVRGLDGFVLASSIAALLLVPFGYSTIEQFVDTGTVFLMALLVTVLFTVPLGLEFIALKRIEPRVFGVLLSLEPAIASVVGMALLLEFLSLNSWIAIALVSIASAGAALAGKKPVGS
jgi:inner membrane transporter RhtA